MSEPSDLFFPSSGGFGLLFLLGAFWSYKYPLSKTAQTERKRREKEARQSWSGRFAILGDILGPVREARTSLAPETSRSRLTWDGRAASKICPFAPAGFFNLASSKLVEYPTFAQTARTREFKEGRPTEEEILSTGVRGLPSTAAVLFPTTSIRLKFPPSELRSFGHRTAEFASRLTPTATNSCDVFVAQGALDFWKRPRAFHALTVRL